MKEIEAWVVFKELNTKYEEHTLEYAEDKQLVTDVVEIVNTLIRDEYIKIHSPLERIEKLEKAIETLSRQIGNISYK
jgi:hypothetical protein